MTDAELVRAAQAGDIAGLGALLERHRALLHAAAVGMLGHGPRAEDAVQETFVIALRRIGALRDPAAARAWLLAVLGNVCRGRAAAARRARGRAGARRTRRRWTRRSSASRCATGCGRRSSGSRSRCASSSSCATSPARAPTRPSPSCAASRRHRAQPLERRPTKLADELLATAAAGARRRDRALAQRSADRRGDLRLAARRRRNAFDGVLTDDLRFVMADRVERRAATRYAEALARDFEDGVRSRVAQVIPGSDVTVVEAGSTARPTSRCTARPPLTQVHFHRDGPTSRIVVALRAATCRVVVRPSHPRGLRLRRRTSARGGWSRSAPSRRPAPRTAR